jgi:hypothetical protein
MPELTHDRRVQAQRESKEQKRGLRRCPAYFAIPPLLYEPCRLTRCPKLFVNIEPPTNGAAAYGRLAP